MGGFYNTLWNRIMMTRTSQFYKWKRLDQIRVVFVVKKFNRISTRMFSLIKFSIMVEILGMRYLNKTMAYHLIKK